MMYLLIDSGMLQKIFTVEPQKNRTSVRELINSGHPGGVNLVFVFKPGVFKLFCTRAIQAITQ